MDILSRRSFLGGTLALGAMRLWSEALPVAEPRLRLGVLSDIHVAGEGTDRWWLKALEYFRAQNVDGVIVAGDLANLGQIDQLQRVADAWFRVFPDDKGADGRHVERLFVYGNHCIHGWKWKEGKKPPLATDEAGSKRNAIGWGDNRARAWRQCFHEDFAPIWMKSVKGYSFVGAHWNKDGGGIPVEAFMAEHAGEIDRKKPFFFIQHEHPKDTVFGPWAWGHDDGRSTRALSPFANAVAVSGHSHYSLTDERSIWQGAFASVNAGSLFNTSAEYALRENGGENRFGYMGGKGVREQAMEMLRPTERQGMLWSVYDDCIVMHRRDFTVDLPLGDDWVLPLGTGEKPYAFAKRRAERSAPQFAADAKVTVGRGKTRKGEDAVVVSFPPAETRRKCRVFEYEVTATLAEDDVELVQAQRRVLAPDFFLPPVSANRRGGTCVFSASELPLKGRYVYSVRPVECFGKMGAPIFSAKVDKNFRPAP